MQFNQIALKIQNTAPDSIPNQPAAQQNIAGAAPNTGALSITSSTQPLDELNNFFAQYPSSKRAAPSFDPTNSNNHPKKLPWSTPEPTKRAPAETKTAWLNNLHKDLYAGPPQEGVWRNDGVDPFKPVRLFCGGPFRAAGNTRWRPAFFAATPRSLNRTDAKVEEQL